MSRWVRRPPSWTQVLIVLGVCGLAAVIIGIEHLTGLELPERDMNWRRGPTIDVAQ